MVDSARVTLAEAANSEVLALVLLTVVKNGVVPVFVIRPAYRVGLRSTFEACTSCKSTQGFALRGTHRPRRSDGFRVALGAEVIPHNRFS